jgi:hypothetical protein
LIVESLQLVQRFVGRSKRLVIVMYALLLRQANGFYGSSGISGRIPEGYTLLEQRFMDAVDASGRSWLSDDHGGTGVQLMEWEKPGWTYHAKGNL